MESEAKRFGRLTVIGDGNKPGYVLCACDCGNRKSIRKTNLTKLKQPTRSCGCLQREHGREVGNKTHKRNCGTFWEESRRYNTNFHVIESNKPPKNNSSGVKGVSFNKNRNLWEAYINVHGKRIALGKYASFEDAVHARKSAEETYFAPLIKMKGGTTDGE